MADIVVGGDSSSYTPVTADVDANLYCRVTATNAVGSASANSNTVGPVTAAAAGPTPAMTNLWTWLKADAGVYQNVAMNIPATIEGQMVKGWQDQGGGGHHFTQPAVLERTATGPLLDLTGGPNSKPFLQFDPISFLQGPSAAALTAGEIFIVIKADTDASAAPQTQNNPWGFGSIATPTLYPYGANGQIYDDWGRADARPATGAPATVVLTAWHLYNVVSTGAAGSAEWTSFLNNVQHFTTAASTVGFIAVPILGGDPNGVQGFPGAIAEVVMYSAKCSAPDKLQTVTYLSSKYALGIV